MSYDPRFDDANPYAAPPDAPGRATGYPPGTVPNYLAAAVIALVCCGGLFAVPAILYAAQVNPKLAAGDYDGALESSRNARLWCIIAVSMGVICWGLGVGLQVLLALSQF